MRIKRVEIIGFKSFCDRAVVQIGEQITGVVGPNGCGKSNIVDAIRWCMGEQSAKHLRGKAMEDVIFAGSESRGPAPMAEVSLTFDDVGFSHETLELGRQTQAEERELAALAGPEGEAESAEAESEDGETVVPIATDVVAAAPSTAGTWVDAEGNKIDSPVDEVEKLLADQPPAFEFSHYTEVTITRRLYRDGISQYFINKSPCRLRDITDFFLGTGVGTKAYAIIEQGRIGQIVSARPQDRRAIIEEAAGITKFKSKKKAAERKLEQTRQNLMRVSDITSELDKRMGTLRRQAQKAERYRKYKSEMKDIELWKASHRWLELAGEYSLVGGRLGEVRTELDTVRTSWAISDARVVTERAELVVEERRLVGVQEKVYELDNKIRLGDSKIGFELREAEELEVRIAGARTEIDEVIGQRERGAIELATRRTELEALEADVERETGEVRAREAAAGEARQMLANGESRLEETRQSLADRKTQIATSQAQLESLAHRRGETSGRLDRVTSEAELHAKGTKDLEREMRRVDGALAELRQTRLDLGTQGEGFASRRDHLANEVGRGEAEVETLRTELHRRRSRLVSLEEIQQRYEGFARGTRAVMQGAEAFTDRVADPTGEPIRGVVADVVRAPELLEVAVEAALGDRLGGVLVANATVGVAAIGYLKQEGGGRSAFVPMTTRDDVRASAEDVGDSGGVPEPVGDDKLGEPRFQSAAMRSLGVPHSFEGEGNPGRGDLSEPVRVSPYGETVAVALSAAVPPPPEGSAAVPPPPEGSAPPGRDGAPDIGPGLTDDAGPDMILVIAAAEMRARALVAAMQADAQLARSGASLRAESLVADAALAASDVWPSTEALAAFDVPGASTDAMSTDAMSTDAMLTDAMSTDAMSTDAMSTDAIEIDALWTSAFDQIHPDQPDPAFAIETDGIGAGDPRAVLWHADTRGDSAWLAAMLADGQLASIGAELRARSLAAEALLADPLFAGLEADGELASSGAALRARSLFADAWSADPLLAGLDADSELQRRGAELRAASLFADATFAGAMSTGAMTAGAMSTGAMTAGAMTAGAMTAGAMTAGAMSAGAMSTGAMSAGAMTAGAMSTDPLLAGLRADAELQVRGAELRAASLFADATSLASETAPTTDTSWMADVALAAHGAALRAQSLRADGELAAAALEESRLVQYLTEMFVAEALQSHAARAIANGAVPVLSSIGEVSTEVPAQLSNDGDVSAQSDDGVPTQLSNDGGVPAQSSISIVETSAPKIRRAPFEFEDRSQLMGAILAASGSSSRRGDDTVGEGVLGRMVDLVGFADGYADVGRRLLGRTVVVDNLQRAIDLYERGVSDRLVTLDGDVVDEDGVVAGGSREAQGAGVLAQKREIRELHEIVGRLEHDLSEAMHRLITAKAELAQVTKAIDGLRKQVHEGEVAIVGHEKDDARVRGELERQRERLGTLAKEQLELEQRLAGITGDEAANRERLERATVEQRELEQMQLDLIALLGGHRDRLEELAQVLTEVRVRAAQLEAQRSAVEAATLRLAQTDAELSARVDRLRSECEESARRATSLREGCERLAAELAILREDRATESRELEDGRTIYQGRLDALSEIELDARELRTRGDALANELGQLELRYGQIAMTRKVVGDQVSERYQLEIEDIVPEYHQRGLVTDTEDNRLTELRELIERMGTDINLTAIEEFAEVSTRFEFLSAQKIDLERAVDQLAKAIDKINKTSRKLFKDTFTAVNATFKEVFPRLFRGGHAALSLSSEEGDLLEAGIEIFAQPPGKKNVTVDQLSGGEKALTAVALVFSIFLIKPSPFCILDEVDAPLDEANVDRYNEIVREMTDRSQFIVITHNKRTMESADNLYGVTMQEPGVSKLVNVNLSKMSPSDRPPMTKTITNVVSI